MTSPTAPPGREAVVEAECVSRFPPGGGERRGANGNGASGVGQSTLCSGQGGGRQPSGGREERSHTEQSGRTPVGPSEHFCVSSSELSTPIATSHALSSTHPRTRAQACARLRPQIARRASRESPSLVPPSAATTPPPPRGALGRGSRSGSEGARGPRKAGIGRLRANIGCPATKGGRPKGRPGRRPRAPPAWVRGRSAARQRQVRGVTAASGAVEGDIVSTARDDPKLRRKEHCKLSCAARSRSDASSSGAIHATLVQTDWTSTYGAGSPPVLSAPGCASTCDGRKTCAACRARGRSRVRNPHPWPSCRAPCRKSPSSSNCDASRKEGGGWGEERWGEGGCGAAEGTAALPWDATRGEKSRVRAGDGAAEVCIGGATPGSRRRIARDSRIVASRGTSTCKFRASATSPRSMGWLRGGVQQASSPGRARGRSAGPLNQGGMVRSAEGRRRNVAAVGRRGTRSARRRLSSTRGCMFDARPVGQERHHDGCLGRFLVRHGGGGRKFARYAQTAWHSSRSRRSIRGARNRNARRVRSQAAEDLYKVPRKRPAEQGATVVKTREGRREAAETRRRAERPPLPGAPARHPRGNLAAHNLVPRRTMLLRTELLCPPQPRRKPYLGFGLASRWSTMRLWNDNRGPSTRGDSRRSRGARSSDRPPGYPPSRSGPNFGGGGS